MAEQGEASGRLRAEVEGPLAGVRDAALKRGLVPQFPYLQRERGAWVGGEDQLGSDLPLGVSGVLDPTGQNRVASSE